MKTPQNYEEMIKDIAAAAIKYGFHLRSDRLTDDYCQIERGHIFRVSIHIEMAEDGPILICPSRDPSSQTGK